MLASTEYSVDRRTASSASRRSRADGRARLAAGERLPFDETYVRPAPRFETADERYSWLSGLVVVGYGEYGHGRIDHRMYRIL